MGTPGGPAHLPSPFASDIGRGRMGRFRRGAIVEHYDGHTWSPISSFGSARQASVALDEAVASGADPDRLRVSDVAPSLFARIATVAVVIAGALLLACVVYIMFGSS